MIYLILGIAFLSLALLPNWWVKSVIKKSNDERDDIKGSGEDFARHLIHRLGMDDSVQVQGSSLPDHYDPAKKTVYLSQSHCQKKSLTAVVIAAHEVGHAMQDYQHYKWFDRRVRFAKLVYWVGMIAPVALALAPLLLLLTKSPLLSAAMLGLGVLSIFLQTLFHLLTLPVELDASFNKALPLLLDGGYLPKSQDYRTAKTLLRAAAFTYIAQSLFNLLNVAYWIRLLKR